MLHKTLGIGSSPHVTSGDSVDTIMRNVVVALLPVTVFAVYVFGIAAALVLTTAIISCVATERFLGKLSNRPGTLGDWSVTVTGLLYGLTLPPHLPLWMVAVGGFFGVSIGKFLFGGLGSNAFNPALVGRAFLQAAFPQAMTHWNAPSASGQFFDIPSSTLTIPFVSPVFDSVTAATPLAMMKFDGIQTASPELFFGLTSGSAGETSSMLILLGGLYLIARKMMNWRIVVSILATVAVISGAFAFFDPVTYPQPHFMLLSGGLMLGAVFMATDPVATPITNAGCWLYGALIGSLVVVIRFWGGMPEGVMYAILLANAVSPHIDRMIQPRVFGVRRGTG
ncbi:MAG: RnfABCDGE type electron transport complex subunit D [Gammaproteobacteria bacterium]|nr:RnfABCDGE type electron transport complex subunit D [Gammaproteobacteria bacterium]